MIERKPVADLTDDELGREVLNFYLMEKNRGLTPEQKARALAVEDEQDRRMEERDD